MSYNDQVLQDFLGIDGVEDPKKKKMREEMAKKPFVSPFSTPQDSIDYNEPNDNLNKGLNALSSSMGFGKTETSSSADVNQSVKAKTPGLADVGKSAEEQLANSPSLVSGELASSIANKQNEVDAKVDGLSNGSALKQKLKGIDIEGAVVGGASLLNDFKGKQFSTDATKAVDKADAGDYLMGAKKGAELGKSLGGGPITMGIGAAVGVAATAIGSNKAVKKWQENKTNLQKTESDLKRKTIDEEYSISQGAASFKNLKDLRQKQLKN